MVRLDSIKFRFSNIVLTNTHRESGAIIAYLAEKYDPEYKISAATDADKFHQLQWLFYQASGQGPYFGQAVWFLYSHAEKIPSAIQRYEAETRRVTSVLDGVLAASPSGWLVGGKPTIADISFVTWNLAALTVSLSDVDFEKEFPAFYA